LLLLSLAILPFAASAQTLTGLSLAPNAVVGPITVRGRVAISAAAPAGGTVVTLSGTGPVVLPSTVTIPAGQSATTFAADYYPVLVHTVSVVTASANGSTKKYSVTINSDAVTGVTAPDGILGGASATGLVNVQFGAPYGGMTVQLHSSDPAIRVPASVFLAEGQSGASFKITTSSVTSNHSATITASADIYSVTTPVVVTPNALQSVKLTPNTVEGGKPMNIVVALAKAAAAGGQVVQLVSNISELTVPDQVTVPAGAKTVTVVGHTVPTALPHYGRITATVDGISTWALAAVNPPTAFVQVSPTTVVAGTTAMGSIHLDVPSPAGGYTIKLTSSKTIASVPATVTIPAGQTTATFPVTTLPTGVGQVQVTVLGNDQSAWLFDIVQATGPANSPYPKARGDIANTGRSTGSGAIGVLGWSKWTTPPDPLGGMAAGTNGDTYYVDLAGHLSSVNAAGSLNWIADGSFVKGQIAVGPDGTIYVGGIRGGLSAIHPNGTVSWHYNDPSAATYKNPAAVAADGTVYIANNAVLSALSSTGTLLWQARLKAPAKTPAVNPAGGVIIADNLGRVYSYTAAGNLAWSENAYPMTNGTPVFASDGSIYLGISTVAGTATFKVLTPSGALKWQSAAVPAGGAQSTTAVGPDGTLYCSSLNDTAMLFAFTPAGAVKWSKPAGSIENIAVAHGGLIFTSTAIYDPTGTVFAALPDLGTIYLGLDGKVYDNLRNEAGLRVYNANGSLSHSVLGRIYTSAPVVASNGTIYTADTAADHTDGQFYAYEANGTKKWSFALSAGTASRPEIVQGSALVGPTGTVYFQSNYYAYALNSNGTVRWSAPYGGNSSPSLGQNGLIYFPQSRLVALTADGKLAWTFKTPHSTLNGDVAIAKDGTLYVGDSFGTLWSLNVAGGVNWSLTQTNQVIGTPSIGADGTIYVWRAGGLNAIDPAGNIKWNQSGVNWNVAIGLDGTIYGFGGGGVRLISPSGAIMGTWSIASSNDYFQSSNLTLAADGTVNFVSDGVLYAFNGTGPLWSKKIGGLFSTSYNLPASSLAIGVGGVIYYTSQSLYSIK